MEQQRESGVKVVEVCLVPPSSHGITTMTTTLPLTYLDIRCIKFLPAERLLFYEFPHTTTTSFYDSVVPNLKHSLSLTLQHFLPLVGNITWPLDSPYPFIKYIPGDVVPFTIAESNSNFNILCSPLCVAVERLTLIPNLNIVSHDQVSLLALQLTLFPNLGFSIGITAHHGAVDGNSMALFIKAWAYTCSKLLIESSTSSLLSLPEHLTPFFDRSVIGGGDTTTIPEVGGPDNRTLKPTELYKINDVGAVKGLFELTPSHIQKLKQHAQSKLKKNEVRLSTFSVTCACVLTCLVKATQPKAKRVVFLIPVDCRSRMNPPVVPTYFGNCSGGLFVMADTTNLLGNDGFIHALEGIIEALNRSQDAVPRPEKVWVSGIQPFMEDALICIGGSPRFEHYSADFGWGRPKSVDILLIDKTGGFSYFESRNNNGGIEIGLVMGKKEMEAFADHFALALK